MSLFNFRLEKPWCALVVPLFCMFFTASAVAPVRGQSPVDLLKESQLTGGLVVHVGIGDGSQTAALSMAQSFLVLGLDVDREKVDAVRKKRENHRNYGPISVDHFDGVHLPLISNLVNFLIVEDTANLSEEEIHRVLCPEGVAYIREKGAWKRHRKPRPDSIDVWTHFLYDASNNAVAHDEVIDLPERLQWTGGPRYSRHHDHMASISAMVSDGPRVYYIIDMGSRWSIQTPGRWMLVARDAFNGTVLWEKPMGEWFTHHYSLKSGPGDLPRRLVAVDGTVYFTPAIDAPVLKLDGATGETLHVYQGTAATEEIVYSDGTLFLKVNRPDNQIEFDTVQSARNHNGGVSFNLDPRRVMAVDAASGKKLWERTSVVMPTTLATDAARVFYHDGQAVIALDRTTGDEVWRKPVSRWSKMQTFFTPTLVVYKDMVYFAGGEKMIPHRGGKDTMTAFHAPTGKVMWTDYHGPSGYMSAEDLLVAGGLVWSGETTSGGYDGTFTGRDPRTGEVKIEFQPDVETYWFHHRCYRGKATDKYLLMSRTGVEFLDPETEQWDINHWVRGGCLYGIMPCNGLLYAPPSNCACYPEIKLFGFNALAPASNDPGHAAMVPESTRLLRGPAYGNLVQKESADPKDWPTYRGDNGRSGHHPVARVNAKPEIEWKTDLNMKLSAPVICDGKVFVAAPDRHRVLALSAKSGEVLWSFTAGARVDSPPTLYRGLAIFGCDDGRIYALRASDGALAWSYLAAPNDRRLVSYNQVESLWPVPGSVLIEDGKLYAIAGRNLFLDDGLRLVILDPMTGKLLKEQRWNDTDPATGEDLQARVMILNMPTGLNDILSSDGERIYLKSQILDKEGNRGPLGPHSGNPKEQGSVQRGETAHLYAPFGGYTDGDWFHRSYWVYGRSFAGGHSGYHQAGKFAPSGRIIVFDDEHVYAFARKPQFYRWTTPLEHHLYRSDRRLPPLEDQQKQEEKWNLDIANTKSLNPTNKPLAVSAWIHAEKPSGVIAARGGPAVGYVLSLEKGIPTFAIRAEEKVHQVQAKEKLGNGWHHLAGVLTGEKELKIYVDGKLARKTNVPSLLDKDPAQAMQIGADLYGPVGHYDSPHGFVGSIDEVKVFFGKVSDEDIRQLADPEQTVSQLPEAETVLALNFEEKNAKDHSGKENHGMLVGHEIVPGKLGLALHVEKHMAASPSNYHVPFDWTRELPILVRAMAQADDTLFLVGPPDLLDEEKTFTASLDPSVQESLQRQDASMRGEMGSVLMAVSAENGKVLGEKPLNWMPRWDGLAVADDSLFLTTEEGTLLRLGK